MYYKDNKAYKNMVRNHFDIGLFRLQMFHSLSTSLKKKSWLWNICDLLALPRSNKKNTES